jgi:hypothetical protein
MKKMEDQKTKDIRKKAYMLYNKCIKRSFDFKDLRAYLLKIEKTKKEESYRTLDLQNKQHYPKLNDNR